MTILTAPTDPAVRVIDGLGREWALASNGSWACLGHPVSVDTFADLNDRYVVVEVTR